MTITVLLVLVLATYRATRLVCVDDISRKFRDWTYLFHTQRQTWWTRWIMKLSVCPHCLGVYVAFAVTAIWFAVTDWIGTWEYLLVATAVAGGQSLAATWSTKVDSEGH